MIDLAGWQKGQTAKNYDEFQTITNRKSKSLATEDSFEEKWSVGVD
jgi:hypothetical protein